MNCNYKVKITDIQTKYKFKVFCTGYDDSEIKEKIDAMYQAWPKATAEGETPTLDNTANATMSIDLKGNTSQFTTTGKNILNMEDSTREYTGNISMSTANHTSIIFSGKAGATYYSSNNLSFTLPAGTYTISSTNNNYKFYFWFRDSSDNTISNIHINNNTQTFTQAVETTKLVVGIEGLTVDTTYNVTTNIQLEAGSTATAYEEYTGGQASPNPDYPQDVQVVTGDNTINICGKNLFNGTFELGGIDINNGNNDSASDRVRTKEYIPVQPNTEYTISGIKASRFAIFYDSNKGYLGYSLVDSQATSGTITTLTNTAYIRWYAIQTNTNINEQLELGTTATTYEAYTGANYPVNLGTMELCKIGDYQDYIYKDNKKWYKYGAIGKVVFSDLVFATVGGNFSQFSTNGNIALVYEKSDLKITGNRNDAFCNLLTAYSTTIFGGAKTGLNVYYNDTKILLSVPFANVENFAGVTLTVNNYIDYTKNYIKSLEGNIYYVLSTPTTTEITDATLISQLNALAGAESYSGQTNISQTNDDKPFILTAKALKDLSNL